MSDAAWLVGAITLPQQDFEIDGNPVSIAAGTYYLRHATASISLVDIMVTLMTASGVTGAACVVLQDRHVRVSGTSSFDIDWMSATLLQAILGWAANVSSTTSADAPNISPLLFSAGDPATPTTRGGTTGYVTNDEARHVSADGTRVRVDIYHTQRWQELSWTNVPVDRLMVDEATDGGGTFHEFYEQSGKLGYPLWWYANQTESSSATPVTWNDAESFGPYAIRELDPDWFDRNVANAEVDGPLEIPLMVVAEVA